MYYLAPDRKGLMTKIVEDVVIPSMKVDKLSSMGKDVSNIRQALVARFINERVARKFLEAYEKCFGSK